MAPADDAGAPAPELDIPLTACDSSNLQAFGYHAQSGTLDVEFKNGQRHRYTGVPAETAQAFEAAESKGRFFSSSIRSKFASRRLGAPD